MTEKIAIIGAGSWGTALAKLLAEKGMDVLIWAYEDEVVKGINASHQNPFYLADITLPPRVRATSDPAMALSERDYVVSVVPSFALRVVWQNHGAYLEKNSILVSCTKGFEENSLKLMSQVLDDCLPDHPINHRAVLSGPSFAKEVAMGLPTSVVIAGKDRNIIKKLQNLFRTDFFLTFTNDDMIGVEVGGAVKNVIAIAAGLSDGLSLGHNTRASIITRGLYEIIKIGNALGASPLTFAGLSGIGDLVLTCTASESRNYTVGFELGKGKSLASITKGMRMVAEGIPTTHAVNELAKKHRINVPICNAMYRILFENLSPRQAVTELCKMELKDELGSILKRG
ncbi:MAG: NAD(P)H-dependent glycerol-3-phosphate dehydrogenase [Pseudomonadota bacterium]